MRGHTNWKKNSTVMGADNYVKLSDVPTKYIFEGIGDAKDGNWGWTCPIYLQDEKTREALTLTANGQTYKAVKDANPLPMDILEMSLTVTDVYEEDGKTPVMNQKGKPKKNYEYTIKVVGKADVFEEEVDDSIDSIPF